PFLAAKTDGTTNEVVAEGEPGAEVEVAIRLRNRGEKAWTPSVTKVGPLPKDMASSIAGSDWPGPTRAFVFAKVVPGTEVADVKFKVRIPASGETKQAFALLDEGVRWFGDPAKPDAEPEVFSVIARSNTTASVAVDAGTAIDPVEEDEPDSLSEVSPDSGCKAGKDPSVPAAYLLGIGALFVLRRRRQPR
ncbi:MAG: hypothetical protein KBF88_16510, partial [Polyangiaceae bacterium]|nr:hypothetical protein [Polyangiaceae bacterium]